jgi:hypothetical protein
MKSAKTPATDISLFISYSTQDGKEASALHRLLSLLGFSCFLAHKDIRKGEQWRQAIVRELRKSDVFIVLLSEHGVTSPWVQQECGMAHLLFETKRRPLIIPVTPNGAIPPGCLSEYQAQAIRLTFWLSKLDTGAEMASKLGQEVVNNLGCGDLMRPRAIRNLKGATVEDFSFLLNFLALLGVTFSEFCSITNHTVTHPSAAYSDSVMKCMYKLLDVHRTDIDKLPDCVKAWNALHRKYQEFKETERRRQEESMRKMLQAMESKAAPKGNEAPKSI